MTGSLEINRVRAPINYTRNVTGTWRKALCCITNPHSQDATHPKIAIGKVQQSIEESLLLCRRGRQPPQSVLSEFKSL